MRAQRIIGQIKEDSKKQEGIGTPNLAQNNNIMDGGGEGRLSKCGAMNGPKNPFGPFSPLNCVHFDDAFSHEFKNWKGWSWRKAKQSQCHHPRPPIRMWIQPAFPLSPPNKKPKQIPLPPTPMNGGASHKNAVKQNSFKPAGPPPPKHGNPKLAPKIMLFKKSRAWGIFGVVVDIKAHRQKKIEK
jgi:hypothetical protein